LGQCGARSNQHDKERKKEQNLKKSRLHHLTSPSGRFIVFTVARPRNRQALTPHVTFAFVRTSAGTMTHASIGQRLPARTIAFRGPERGIPKYLTNNVFRL
jgi:hypothetical protein